MTEKQKLQFEMLKKREIFIWNIEDLTDEMKWWGCQNDCIMNSISLTKEMLIYMIKTANVAFNEKQLKDVLIPEEVWIEGIRRTDEPSCYFNNFLKIVLEYASMTSEIACEMCIVAPFYYNNEKVCAAICNATNADELREKIKKSVFKLMEERSFNSWYKALHPDFNISDEDWEWIIGNDVFTEESVKYFVTTRNDLPIFVKRHLLSLWITNTCVFLKDFGELSVDDLMFWCETHKQYFEEKVSTNDYYLEGLVSGVKCKDMARVLEQHGWLIKYLNTSSEKLQKAAINNSPDNVQYIKNPSDKVALYALSRDKSVARFLKKTEAICNYLGIENEDYFPSEYYLVKMTACVCDEGDIVNVCVVKGKKMEEFLQKEISISFGNLCDDTPLTVKDVAKYWPITEEELAVIKKFRLDDIKSGYFGGL